MKEVVCLVILVAFLVLFVGAMLDLFPGFEQVSPDSFAYPADGTVVLVTAEGEYTLASQGSGCYLLTEPPDGQARGYAHKVWPICGW